MAHPFQIGASAGGIAGGAYAWILSLIHTYGYLGIVVLMILEGASLPIPSEVIAPAAGFLSARGVFSFPVAFIAVLLGNTVGIAIDYTIGYYIGKKVVYNNLHRFRIKKSTLKAFDAWFNRNGAFAVFISRLIPEVRGLMSFPAGFAKMPLKKFFFWSILGSAIWDIVLMLFGYYVVSTSSVAIEVGALAIFIVILYFIYKTFMSSVRGKRRTR